MDDAYQHHTSDVVALPVAALRPSPRNPRNRLDDVEQLAASIRAYGLLQPVVVRDIGEGLYEVVAGHRRLAAIQSLGWTTLPCIVRAASEEEAYLLTLVENLQRDDLSAREEAHALEQLVRNRGRSTRQVADAIKRSQAYVSKRLRVFDDVLLAPLVLGNQLSVSVAEELLPLSPTRRRALAERAIADGLDRRGVRHAVQAMTDRTRAPSPHRSSALLRQLRELRTSLNEIFPADLDESHRREMRQLFLQLSTLAKAPSEPQAPVIPALPVTSARRRG